MRLYPLLVPVLLAVLGLAACAGQPPSSIDLLTPAATTGPTTDLSGGTTSEPELDGTFDRPWTPVPPPSVDPSVTVTARDGSVRYEYDGVQRDSGNGWTDGPCWYEDPPSEEPGSWTSRVCDSTPPPPAPCPDPALDLTAADGEGETYVCIELAMPTAGTSFFDDVPAAQVESAQAGS